MDRFKEVQKETKKQIDKKMETKKQKDVDGEKQRQR